ncbi:DUF2834 domain-containing protein [Paraferrimonas sedimenticola]|uniref:DUF2834 domain-containing protein n=1 Tax=Paraferrimonas sedimenticola TaxID=375674 RepID=UPI000BA974BF|nr:DUF2834 domain-containing protein [Paraferrimonas sedimenticola]
MKLFYGLLCVLGLLLPYSAFLPWLFENGLNPSLLVAEAINTRVGAFAWMDVILTSIVVLGLIIVEGTKLGIRMLWLPIVSTFVVGPSLGLPIFLLLREYQHQRHVKIKLAN